MASRTKTKPKAKKILTQRRGGRGEGRAGNPRPGTRNPIPESDGPPPPWRIENLAVSAIACNVPAKNDRRYTREALAGLAESLKVEQLQPIAVNLIADAAGGGLKQPYELIWGRRRLLAARQAGLKTIRARVYRLLAPAQVDRLHGVENIQRTDWDPVEEAAVVGELIAAAEYRRRGSSDPAALAVLSLQQRAALEREAVAEVAEQLAKTTAWVSQRAYLGRLSGRARELVKLGRLPLAHAVEIARLADPELRDRLAEESASGEQREQPMPLRWLKERVGKHLMSLDPGQVPWKLHLPLAGEPACTACPKNTANQAALFDGEPGLATNPTCTDPVCFNVKAKLAQRELKRAVGLSVEAVMTHQGVRKSEKVEAAVKDAVHTAPEVLEPRAVRQAAEAAVGAWTPALSAEEKEAQKAERERVKAEEEAKARREAEAMAAYNAELRRAEKLVGLLGERCRDWPGLRVMVHALMATQAVADLYVARGEPEKRAKLLDGSAVTAALGAVGRCDWESLLELEKRWPRGREVADAHTLAACGLVGPLAAALEIEIGATENTEKLTQRRRGAEEAAADEHG